MREPFTYTICAMCGKQYIEILGSIYKIRYKDRINRCCSYTCYQNALKFKEKLHYENIKNNCIQ